MKHCTRTVKPINRLCVGALFPRLKDHYAHVMKTAAPITVTTTVQHLYLNKREIAEALDVSQRTIDEWRKKRWIPSIKAGGVIRFDLEKVRTALEKRHQIDPLRK
jgi:excisionase family DNA binding protein